MSRRLSLETPSGQVIVRDQSLPGARLVDVELPDGRRARLAEHLCGWTCAAATEDGPLWPTVADAVAAFSGATRDGTPWISVLEEYATRLGAGSVPLPEGARRRLEALRATAPALFWDGPRPADGGGFYVFVGGLSDGASIMEFGDTEEE
ncbi:MAG: hypothetical protein ACR2N6_05525, partial [Miltoncostaeaceae bacterium]